MGWIASIIIGTLVGWLAGKIMNSSHGLLINFLLGWAGSALGKWIAGLLNISSNGLAGDIVFSIVGACLILFIFNKIKK
ncbi:MAG: GlsB/YeaQ/YmgE family stress response membrane protein [Anaerolineaceae bacterium]|nr:GlsB/YeaQ/YmgE family stress response membrane protein [Anaerolineaceae bacterium]